MTLPDDILARLWSPPADPEQGHLRFERAGTQVWIQGRGPDAMRALAVDLRPIGG